MKHLDYAKNYGYAYAHSGNFIEQEFLPDTIQGVKFYEPGGNARENEMRAFLNKRWKHKYNY